MVAFDSVNDQILSPCGVRSDLREIIIIINLYITLRSQIFFSIASLGFAGQLSNSLINSILTNRLSNWLISNSEY